MLSKKESLLLFSALLGIFIITSFIAIKIFQSYPYSMDENSLMVQADLFAQGKLYYKAEFANFNLTDNWIINKNGRIFSKYPPAPAAFLALGVIIGWPELINPLISTFTALIIFLTIRNIFSIKIAWLVLGILGSSPYFYPYAASLFAQPLSLCLSTLSFYLLSLYQKVPSIIKTILIGAAIGLLFLTRQVEAAALGFSVGIPLLLLAIKNKSIEHFFVFLFFSILGLLGLLFYNYVQTGTISISSFPVWSSEFVLSFPEARNYLENLQMLVSSYTGWWLTYTIPSFYSDFIPYVGVGLFATFIFGSLYPMPLMKLSLLTFIILIVCLYVFHPSTGWPVYGSRYWYCTFGAFLIIAANFICFLNKTLPIKIFIPFYVVLIVLQSSSLVLKLSEYDRRFKLVKAVNEDIKTTCPEKSIVLLQAPPKLMIDKIKFFNWWDFKRNPRPLANRLYVDLSKDAETLKTYFPEYNICTYNFRSGDLQNKLPNFPVHKS